MCYVNMCLFLLRNFDASICFYEVLMLLLYTFITLLCIPEEYESGEVGIGKVYMAYMEKVVVVKRAPTSQYYIAGMFDGDVIFISICFLILYTIKKLDSD